MDGPAGFEGRNLSQLGHFNEMAICEASSNRHCLRPRLSYRLPDLRCCNSLPVKVAAARKLQVVRNFANFLIVLFRIRSKDQRVFASLANGHNYG